MRTAAPIAIAFTIITLSLVSEASAIRFQPRPAWHVGTSWGVGRGRLTAPDGSKESYRNGATPQARVGRTLGSHAMVSFNWESWLIEFPANQEDLKVRRTLQNFGLGLTWLPGNPDNYTGGFYIRAGVGLGLSGTGVKEAAEGVKQHRGERVDETGIAYFGELGYEVWITSNFTAGLGATANYFDINGDDFVDTAWYTAVVMNLNLYFQ